MQFAPVPQRRERKFCSISKISRTAGAASLVVIRKAMSGVSGRTIHGRQKRSHERYTSRDQRAQQDKPVTISSVERQVLAISVLKPRGKLCIFLRGADNAAGRID